MISSNVTAESERPLDSNGLLTNRMTYNAGLSSRIPTDIGRAIKGASSWLCRTPSDLGRISVNCNIRKVSTSEKRNTYLLPYNSSNCAPATVAPIVWAAVLTMRMTAMGRSIFCLNRFQIAPNLGCWRESCATWLGVKLNRLASRSEQSPDTKSAVNTLMRNSSILKNFAVTPCVQWSSDAVRPEPETHARPTVPITIRSMPCCKAEFGVARPGSPGKKRMHGTCDAVVLSRAIGAPLVAKRPAPRNTRTAHTRGEDAAAATMATGFDTARQIGRHKCFSVIATGFRLQTFFERETEVGDLGS